MGSASLSDIESVASVASSDSDLNNSSFVEGFSEGSFRNGMTYFDESNTYTKQIDFTIIKGIANFEESDKTEILQWIKKKKLENLR